MPSLFTKIIQGDLPSIKVAESETCLAFMDINPLQIGHLLVIPKREVDEIYELEEKEYSELNVFARRIAKAMKKALGKRIGMVVLGLGVPHAHIHLIPFDNEADINTTNPKLKLTTEELIEIAEKIKEQL